MERKDHCTGKHKEVARSNCEAFGRNTEKPQADERKRDSSPKERTAAAPKEETDDGDEDDIKRRDEA